MIRIFLPLICAALGFAAASCSQSEGPFARAEAPVPPRATAHGAAAAAMPSPSPPAQDPGGAASATGQTTSGSPPDPDQTASAAAQPVATPPDGAPSLDQASPSAGSQAPASQSVAEGKPDVPTSTPAERRASTLIGMQVVATDGSPLGEVKDVIFDRQGQATHLVIAYTAESGAAAAATSDDNKPPSTLDGKLTAVPWDAAVASMKAGRLVLDGAKLQDAPSFAPDAWPNLDDLAWNATADAYWRKAVRAAIAAHPGAIDSTARQRGRRSRDGSGGY